MASLRSRFEASADLIDCLLEQKLVANDRSIAEAIAADGELFEFAPGEVIIEQGESGREVFFLMAGEARVIVNQVRLYTRQAGVTVGEMSALNPKSARAATLEAEKPTVAWRITHRRLEAIADQHPLIWKRLAIDLAARLEQRNQFVNRVNISPRIFMICSAESLPIARAIRIGLEHAKATVVLWSDEQIFETGSYPLEALEQEVAEADFAIALAEPDDIIRSRHRQQATVRDNVIFELGFFMSRLGRSRTLLLVPRGEDVKLPSDFKGLTPITYRNEGKGRDLAVALGPTIDQIYNIVEEKGVRASLVETK